MIKNRKVNVFYTENPINIDSIVSILSESYINYISQVQHKDDEIDTKQ